MSGRISLQMDGPGNVEAKLAGDLPHLVFKHGGRTLKASAGELEAAFSAEKDRTTLSLTRLVMDRPSLEAAGELRLEHAPETFSVSLEGKNIDLSSVKDPVLAFAGHVPHVAEICDAVKAGQLAAASYRARGDSFSGLWTADSMQLSARLENIRASLPESGRSAEGASGTVGISGGVLKAKDLKAAMGNTHIADGYVEMDLLAPRFPFHAALSFEADAGELRPEIMRYMGDGDLKKELSRITKLEGHVKGTIRLRGAEGPVQVDIETTGFKLSGSHAEVPYPIEIDGGHIHVTGARVDAGEVNVKVGASRVSGLSGSLEMTAEPEVKLAGGVRVRLDELFPWLSGYDRLEDAFQQIVSLKGEVDLSDVKLQGPLKDPAKWLLASSGSVENVTMDLKGIKSGIRLSGANFNATRKGSKGRIAFQEAKIGFRDAALEASGHMDYGAGGVEQLRLEFDGRGGDKTVSRVFEVIELPPAVAVKTPLAVSGGRLQWGKGKPVVVAGRFTIADGPEVILDVSHSPEHLAVRKLHIRDQDTDAVITLDLKGREAAFGFKGHFRESTADRMLADNRIPPGSIKGDFNAYVSLDRPWDSRASGTLECRNVLLPLETKTPLIVSQMALDADQEHILVKNGRLGLGDMGVSLNGALWFSKLGFFVNGEVTGGEVDLTRIEKMTGKKSSGDGGSAVTRGGGWNVPLYGIIRLRLGRLKHEHVTLEPFHADVALSENLIQATMKDVRMCGIAFPGIVKINPSGVAVDFRPEAKDQGLDPTIDCLTNDRSEITGTFDIKGHLATESEFFRLPESVKGDFHVEAREGEYRKDIVMNRVLTFLSVSELFRGNVPTLEERVFRYHSFSADAALEAGGKIRITGVMDGYTMDIGAEGEVNLFENTIDMNVLAAPMKTTDWFVKRLPLIGHALGGNLLVIPVKVSGSLADPKVSALRPAAVGKRITGILRRTFELPVRILDPFKVLGSRGGGGTGVVSYE